MSDEINPLRGEIALTGDSGRTYTIRLGTNALARMQETFNEPTIKSLLNRLAGSAFGKGGDFSILDLRRMVQASVVSNGGISEEEAGDLIDDCGYQETLAAFNSSLQASLHRSNGNGANPQKGSTRKKANSADS